jgi:hypothetical protein
LAGPLDPTLAGMLAAVFEPEPETMSFARALARSGCGSAHASLAGFQTINFKRRSRERSSPLMRDEIVWSWMQQRLDDGTAVSVKDAKRQAMEAFRLTPSVVNQIWLDWLSSQRQRAALEALDLDKP